MDELQIKESLIALLDGITRADSVIINREMTVLDEIVASGVPTLHPQLEHFLQRRSYAKALVFLGGTPGTSPSGCAPRQPSRP